jgi:hypothetical protein
LFRIVVHFLGIYSGGGVGIEFISLISFILAWSFSVGTSLPSRLIAFDGGGSSVHRCTDQKRHSTFFDLYTLDNGCSGAGHTRRLFIWFVCS